ncbi:unnamed protein product [Gongylonema pulchrum]|uniref:TPR_REGION domain-containing protein n=1 Tax=Gongylonema pulchrum TaxID=637853 RepID=A0A183CZK3_9BILA|nr:unnamed protein product [Gongylonema pulchrum]
MCPRSKLFRGYIDLELQLREFDRCRILYGKFLEFAPENSSTWIKFAEMETILGDVERARAILALAVKQPALDMPEVILSAVANFSMIAMAVALSSMLKLLLILAFIFRCIAFFTYSVMTCSYLESLQVLWKAFIDFEIGQEEYHRARQLYESLLDRTNHVKVWISLAEFEMKMRNVQAAREVYERANRTLTNKEKEAKVLLLESWMQFETKHGDEKSVAAVTRLMPKKVKKRREILNEDGVDAGWEEYFDYVFPDDQGN